MTIFGSPPAIVGRKRAEGGKLDEYCNGIRFISIIYADLCGTLILSIGRSLL